MHPLRRHNDLSFNATYKKVFLTDHDMSGNLWGVGRAGFPNVHERLVLPCPFLGQIHASCSFMFGIVHYYRALCAACCDSRVPNVQVPTVLRVGASLVDLVIVQRWNTDLGLSDRATYMLGYNIIYQVAMSSSCATYLFDSFGPVPTPPSLPVLTSDALFASISRPTCPGHLCLHMPALCPFCPHA